MIEKNTPFRSDKWLSAVRSIEYCVRCGQYGVQAAHRNEGKSFGRKTSDCFTAALCQHCHERIDHGKDLSREEKRAEIDSAILKTIEKLVKLGKVVAV